MAQRKQNPNTPENLAELTQTARDTNMGGLLRQFWQPVALSSQAAPGKAAALRVFSEELTFYRGRDGAPFLVAGRCAHRCTRLHTGWVESDEIRCMYHC